MTSGTYGTLQGDASPSPRRSYRLSKVAKIALALIACSAAAVIALPGTRSEITRLFQDTVKSQLGTGKFDEKMVGSFGEWAGIGRDLRRHEWHDDRGQTIGGHHGHGRPLPRRRRPARRGHDEARLRLSSSRCPRWTDAVEASDAT